MKIQITENANSAMSGYTIVPIVSGKIDFNKIVNNSSEEILALGVLDNILIEDSLLTIQNICSKIRLGGCLYLSGVELNLVARNLINNSITTEEFNKLIQHKKSFHKLNDIINILQSLGLMIEYAKINGNNYEVKAIRPKT